MIRNTSIEKVFSFKLLETISDEHLSYKNHVILLKRTACNISCSHKNKTKSQQESSINNLSFSYYESNKILYYKLVPLKRNLD